VINVPIVGIAVHPHCGWTGRFVRKGLKGHGVAAQAAEPPESPVFCGAKNASKGSREQVSYIC
jgi:hypothetical protein